MNAAAIGPALEQAGWSADRDVTQLVRRWEATGLRLNDNARAQLASFGGLVFEPTSRVGEDFAPVPVAIDPLEVDLERLACFAPSLGELFAIGTVDHGNGYLAMDAGGGIHLLFEEHRYVGAGIAEALACLLQGKWPVDTDS